MGKTQLFTSDSLKIEVREDEDQIELHWKGKSILRKPSTFITPILVDVLQRGGTEDKRIVLDFCNLDYMNSSTVTPIIKILERAKRGENQVTVLYKKSLKWQDLSFSALEIFQTKDKRVEIKGLD
jgi:hypothetical protein